MVVNGKLSRWADTLKAIPQGSVLGTIVFVIFINDLSDGVTGTVKIFADEIKLFQAVWSMSDHFQLRKDLENLVDFSNK